MNLNNAPTEDQLKSLLAQCNDSRANHLLWVSRSGDVNIEVLNKGLTPVGFVESRPDLLFRYESFACGNGYVGLKAANDEKWVNRLFTSLQKEWKTYKGAAGPIYIDFF